MNDEIKVDDVIKEEKPKSGKKEKKPSPHDVKKSAKKEAKAGLLKAYMDDNDIESIDVIEQDGKKREVITYKLSSKDAKKKRRVSRNMKYGV